MPSINIQAFPVTYLPKDVTVATGIGANSAPAAPCPPDFAPNVPAPLTSVLPATVASNSIAVGRGQMDWKMAKCARPCCVEIGIHRCSTCLREAYCSGECQKADWKAHKLICKTLKKLSNQLQPYRNVVNIMNEILGAPEKIGRNVRVLDHALSYAEFQFGDRVEGKSYRERGNGDRISNWIVEIVFLRFIYGRLIYKYINDQSLSTIMKDIKMIPYLEKTHQLLMPWSILIDSDVTNVKDVLNKDDTNHVLGLLSNNDGDWAGIHINRNEYNLAENHCQRALSSAKKYDGEIEKKTSLLRDAFRAYGNLRLRQDNYTDAVIFYEEAYNCVAMAYNPVHPEVQTAASSLIECLLHKGDLYDAERFSQMTLDSLRDPANGVDQDSEAVAQGYYNLGSVICKQNGDLEKAERLTREAYRIRIQLYGNDHYFVGVSAALLASILRSQGKMGDETKKLYESFLAISIKNEGLDGKNTAIGNSHLMYYHVDLAQKELTADTKKEHLCLAKSYVKEAIRICTKLRGSTHLKTVKYISQLLDIEKQLSEA
jgi:tetratricopeptide (TPR) repeat protein